MMKFIKGKTVVSKVGKLEDYINLPVVKDSKAIGVINNATELDDGYELEMTLFKVGIELFNDTPTSISIG